MEKSKQITKNRRTIVHSFSIQKNSNIFEAAKQAVTGKEHGTSVMIPHVCNNVNAFGAGFASAVAEEYYEVKANFHLLGRSSKMGQVQYVTGNPYTPYSGGIYDLDQDFYTGYSTATYNSERLPEYFAVNLRADKTFTFEDNKLKTSIS